MNFSIIVPGSCNAHCSFCFWKEKKAIQDYFTELKQVLMNAPVLKDKTKPMTLSITGGEPTISPYLVRILMMVKEYKSRFSKVVLTTNGTNLLRIDNELLMDSVDHINISRHHYDESINSSIFGTSEIPDLPKLKTICEKMNKLGIDVTFNCVITTYLDTTNIKNYIDYAKEAGASAICFRKQHSDNLDPTAIESYFSDYKYVSKSSCPVCRLDTQIINGIKVYWQASKIEPSDTLDVYEVIFHPTGILTCDWNGEIQVKRQEKSRNVYETYDGDKLYVRAGEEVITSYVNKNSLRLEDLLYSGSEPEPAIPHAGFIETSGLMSNTFCGYSRGGC